MYWKDEEGKYYYYLERDVFFSKTITTHLLPRKTSPREKN
jgi:hypothetical protein